MAQRRMFNLKIIDTDKFLDMPVSARELYFQLSMRADDDGFIGNPKRIIKMIGASDDDMKVLFGKQFIIPFSSGVCVISDWKIHNYIQKDRYQETQYKEEKKQLKTDENGSWIQNGYKLDTQVRLGKVRIEEECAETAHTTPSYKKEFLDLWEVYPEKKGKLAAYKAWQKVKVPTQELIRAVNKQKTWDQWEKGYIPHLATWLNQGRWEDEDKKSIDDEKIELPEYYKQFKKL